MSNYLKQSIELGRFVENGLKTRRTDALELLKAQLKEKVSLPMGWQRFGFPLIFSMALSVVSFAIPQVYFWVAVSHSLSLPEPTFIIGMLITNLLFCLLIIPAMMWIARGYLRALQLYLGLIFVALLASLIFFISVMLSLHSPGDVGRWNIFGSLSGITLMALSVRCVNSESFVKTIALGLHNRILREQTSLHTHQFNEIKQ
ncbi:hypothetical protein VG539_003235 [Cronobacter muytjensii]|uniref:hypothetical protein n=1 Tax=Cronobacter muytjensii TaxID=413501 RepID=UPI000577245E|nr:hypothetical protein [Cronobacter muytjensii]ALB70041.1 hypothetical protein AFK63_05230 [Cronobacter muytjensii ATCC 51329]EGT4339767.1 hypothetical protein [Cronobacter muytjensii]EKS1846443.1 hypothetical protein [Cronobacter muytjensii]ELY3985758.1 hypothetical protein [Cronobacter muytjensii]ELY4520741.1 hypothetical protein [Cronobacter muytjensii]